MGWLTIPAPGATNRQGEPVGPYVAECQHRDCAASRADAARPCAICGDPIGYDVAYYGSGLDMRHAACEMAKGRT